MKTPPRSIQELAPSLIRAWRQITRHGGPDDFLQTREFRLCVSCVVEGAKLLKEHANWMKLWARSPLLGAYLCYFWPIHYQEALAIFHKQQRSLGRVLDLGAGPGPYTLAALEWGACEVWALEPSERCVMALSEFAARLGHTLNVRQWSYPKPLCLDGQFDTILCGHSLLEISAQQLDKAIGLIEMMQERLSPTGQLLLVEQADPKAQQFLKQLQATLASRRFNATLEPLSVKLEKTRLMSDLMRSCRKQEERRELTLLRCEKAPSGC